MKLTHTSLQWGEKIFYNLQICEKFRRKVLFFYFQSVCNRGVEVGGYVQLRIYTDTSCVTLYTHIHVNMLHAHINIYWRHINVIATDEWCFSFHTGRFYWKQELHLLGHAYIFLHILGRNWWEKIMYIKMRFLHMRAREVVPRTPYSPCQSFKSGRSAPGGAWERGSKWVHF